MAETVKNDGGSAFPGITHIEAPQTINHMTPKWSRVKSDGGMSLRDWFAGRALSGLLSDGETIGIMGKAASEAGKSRVPYMASAAYEIADAMLAERSK